MTNDNDDTAVSEATLTYIGRRANHEGKLTYVYLLEGEELRFKRALLPATVGAHLSATVELTADGARRVTGVRYAPGRTVGDDITRYAALDAAAVGANEARRNATKADPLMDALEPIRDA